MNSGVPIVATDVGSCRELVMGGGDDDRKLGPAGVIVDVGDPHATAKAVLSILQNEKMHKEMAESGIKRIEKFYGIDAMIDKYRELYTGFLKKTQNRQD